jgi:hypothetical protein
MSDERGDEDKVHAARPPYMPSFLFSRRFGDVAPEANAVPEADAGGGHRMELPTEEQLLAELFNLSPDEFGKVVRKARGPEGSGSESSEGKGE